jgi:hypothetical protein
MVYRLIGRREKNMINEILRIVLALSILVIVFFAYMKKDSLPKLVTYTILSSIALSMALSGLAGLIADIEFLNFMENIFRTLSDLVVYVEIGLIIFLLFFTKHKTKIAVLKVIIIVYIVVKLLLVFGVFN